MKYKSVKILQYILFSITVFFSVFFYKEVRVYGEEIELTKFTPDNINYTINDGKLKINCIINDEGNFEVHGDMNTSGLEEGYYTSYIYENKNSDWSSFEGAAFHIENMGEGSIDLNLSVVCSDGSHFNVSRKNVMLMKRDDSSIIERIHLPYGAVNINRGFMGKIYIPFKSLSLENSKDEEITKDMLSDINSWGISITCREDETRHFKISDFALINSNQDLQVYLNSTTEVTGDDNIVIPTAGEYIYQYKCKNIQNSDSLTENKFILDEKFKDIEISSDGLLKIGCNAQPEIITIDAVENLGDSKSVGETKSVNLIKSWNYGEVYEDGVSMEIPEKQDYTVAVNKHNPFIDRKFTILMRMICIGIIFTGVRICYLWFKSVHMNKL